MSDNKVPIISGIAIVVGLIAWLTGGSAGALNYHDDWGDALEDARTSGKPLLINFGGPW